MGGVTAAHLFESREKRASSHDMTPKQRYYQKNRESLLRKAKEYREKNIDAFRARDREKKKRPEVRARDRERKRLPHVRAQGTQNKRRWRENNPEKAEQTGREWREKNRDLLAQKKKEWRKNNLDRERQLHREWRKNNPDAVKNLSLKKYGISLGDFKKRVAEQNNACAMCLLPFSDIDRPYVDHCHSTQEVRGLLHRDCNLILGHARDSISILEGAIEYLRRKSVAIIPPPAANFLSPNRWKDKEWKSQYNTNIWLKGEYGITLDQRDGMIALQEGKCQLCRMPFGDGGLKPCVDHCHETGGIRSILHGTCNTLIGIAQEDTILLQKSIEYLNRFGEIQ